MIRRDSCHAKSVAWTNRVIFPGFIMWATVLWLFGCLASLDGPLVTNSLFSQTCLSHLLLGVAWAVDSFSRGEGGDVKHTTFMGSYLQSMLKLVPWFVVTYSTANIRTFASSLWIWRRKSKTFFNYTFFNYATGSAWRLSCQSGGWWCRHMG